MKIGPLEIIVAAGVLVALWGGSKVASSVINRWPGQAPEPYRNAITAAEIREGLPHNLLARLLWQESRFREDIITGRVTSPAGAVGIAQIVPRWHPDVNPLDPWASIDYAARYLRDLRRQTGSWETALAAYNWGIGNLNKALSTYGRQNYLAYAPKETRDYVSQIRADVALSGGALV